MLSKRVLLTCYNFVALRSYPGQLTVSDFYSRHFPTSLARLTRKYTGLLSSAFLAATWLWWPSPELSWSCECAATGTKLPRANFLPSNTLAAVRDTSVTCIRPRHRGAAALPASCTLQVGVASDEGAVLHAAAALSRVYVVKANHASRLLGGFIYGFRCRCASSFSPVICPAY